VPFPRSSAVPPRTPNIEIRRARAEDMLACAWVFVRAVNDLSRRQGQPVARRHPKVTAARLDHLRRTTPRGFYVALRGGRVAAFASTILREEVHFLSMFWSLPALQSQGVGHRLLERAFRGPNAPPGAVRCVYASLDRRAQALYNKFGMVPRSLVYGLSAPTREAHLPPPPERPVELGQVGPTGKVTPRALALGAALDRRVRGCRRDDDLAFTITSQKARFFEAREDGAPVGYIMVDKDGTIGPGGVIDPRYTEGLLWSALAVALDQRTQRVSMQVTGLNREALLTAFSAGLKIGFMGAWMTQREFGKFDRYIAAYGDIF
jgi:ribosomal protein S18 acetylase RimI-like enzyme